MDKEVLYRSYLENKFAKEIQHINTHFDTPILCFDRIAFFLI